MKKIIITLLCLFISGAALASPPKQKSKFYDFGEQVIDGEIKTPTALFTEGKKRVEFERLLNLKKSFLPNLLETSKESAFK
jgi:hypothetical protein